MREKIKPANESVRYIYMSMPRIAQIDSEGTKYFGTDHLGSTTLLVDSTGNVLHDKETTPFGDQEDKEGLFFTGKQWDEDAELYYFNARWYDADTGRFITEDPIKDGLLWYAYAMNNPMRFIDPMGLEQIEVAPGKVYDTETMEVTDVTITPEQAMQNQMQDVAFEYEIMNLIWKNKTILPDLLNKLPPKMTELKNDMKGLVEQYAERDYDESFLMSNTSIDVIRGTYRAPGKENYDGKLELKVLGVPIFEVLIHTWAEHEGTHPYKDGTISLGKLTGKLEKNSKSFSEYIKLFSDWYIHPNALTKNGKTEPYNGGLPRSKGCLVMDINNWNVFVDALSTLGFEFGNESKNKIDVNISLSENADKSNIQHAFGYQPERYGYWQRKEYWRF